MRHHRAATPVLVIENEMLYFVQHSRPADVTIEALKNVRLGGQGMGQPTRRDRETYFAFAGFSFIIISIDQGLTPSPTTLVGREKGRRTPEIYFPNPSDVLAWPATSSKLSRNPG
ncbi:unnamed protein product [Zymoseptoria tritici ST99CH_3D7]|uniref:Uncharacterized protein n=1 Tax=Zymoseptoria tritici (strain ST99CH_3D7) TaxID=1276538 RepID=A0A1X7REC7_ZYMT9|nr:unnamed protein product [Zymoseptoria tritici ST99CH_3D7]